MQPKQDIYPVFEANQVLTNRHLNQVFDHLEEQGRLTRADFIGIGIMCGLEVRLAAGGNSIVLTKGCGVTSEGYPIVEPEEDVRLEEYKKYVLPDEVSEYLPFKFNVPDPQNNTQTIRKQYDLWELFEKDEPKSTKLTADFLSEKAVLLFWELKKDNLRNCSPNNCDDRGAEVTTTVRRLLIGKSDLDKIIMDIPLVKFQESVSQLPEVPLPRIAITNPGHLQNYEQTYRNYFQQIIQGKTLVHRLKSALNDAYLSLKNLIPDLTDGGISQLPAHFSFPATPVTGIQYHFDLLRDLTAAYHELRDTMIRKIGLCMPDGAAFPRHLSLGLLTGDQTARYRTRFFPAPGSMPPEKTLDSLRFLFERINRMVAGFSVPLPANPFRITPSIWGIKHLTGKSLPFYYSPDLRDRWDVARKGSLAAHILSWHNTTGPEHVQNPLDYDLEPYNFFRFEGHVGKNLIDFSVTLPQVLKSNRLPVSILYVSTDAVGSFLDKHFAITHEAGALCGGTLVLLHGGASNLVLADFALPYRVEEKTSDCLCRVEVMECAYEWFDSRRHLSNLARREYRYSPRLAVHAENNQKESQEHSRSALGKYYVIRVYKYEIQGEPQINNPRDVRIPIDELIAGQLSAIARALNAAFPDGVVFDHQPDSNKLLIRYFSNQTFRIEWRGLQGNQMLYAYESGKIERWQHKKWEAFGGASHYQVECRLRNEYRAEEYQWLQNYPYYEAKYPVPVPMPSAAELIEWEKITQKRSTADLPADVSQAIKTIRKDINETFNVGNLVIPDVVLIGSWANGSWVSMDDKQKYPKEFKKLRFKVTGKTGPSDIDLLIERADDTVVIPPDMFEEVEKKFGYRINFVYGKKDAQKGKPGS